MASFMDYYQDELRKRSSGQVDRPKGVSLSSLSGPAKQEDAGGPLAPVNWIMDMLSRPTYATVNANKGNVDRMAQAGQKLQQGDILGGIGDAITAIPSAPTFLDPGSALLNAVKAASGNNSDRRFTDALVNADNNQDLKQSNEALLEYTMDKGGSTFDPNYKDVQDNLAPGFKGAAGFALDVALDPTTYISGTGLLQGARGVAKLADKGLSEVSRGLAGVKAPVKGAEEAAQAAVKTPKPKTGEAQMPNNPFEGFNDLNPGEFRPARAPEATKIFPLETVGTDLARVQDILGGATPSPARPTGVSPRLALEAGANAAPDAAKPASLPVDELLSGLQREAEPSPVAEPVIPDVPVAASSLEDLINASPSRQPIADVLTKIADDVSGSPRAAKPFIASEWLPTQTARRTLHLPGDAPYTTHSISELAQIANDTAQPVARRKAATKYVVDAITKEKTSRGDNIAAADAISAFRARASADENSLRSALGEDLFDYLSRVNSPAKFQRSLADIRRVIEPDEGIHDALRNMDQNLARVLSDRLGVPRAARAKTPEEAAARADELLSKNDPYQAALAKGLAKALDAELVDLKSKGYIHYLKKLGLDVARTAQKRGEGLGRYVDQLNGFSQYTMLRNQADAIELAALDIMRGRGAKGMTYRDLYSAQRTEIYKQAVMRVMDDQAKLLDDIGAHMSIGLGADTVQLSMSEAYRGIMAAADELGIAKTIDQGLFNYGTQAAPTAVTDAVAAAVAGGTRDDVLAILTDPKKYGNKGLLEGPTGKRPNNLIDSGHGWGFAQNAKAAAQRLADEVGAVVKPNPSGKGGWFVSYRANGENKMAEALSDAIMQAQPSLAARAAENEAAFVARTRQEIHKLSTDELAKIESFLKDPSGTIAKIRAFKARGKRIEAEAAAINASADAVRGAEEIVDASLGEELVSTMTAAGKADAKYAGASTALELRQANESFTDDVWDAVVEDMQARPTPVDLEDPITGLRANEEWADIVEETTPLHGDWRDMLFDEAEEFITPAGSGAKKPKKGRKGRFVDLSEDAPAMIDSFGQRVQDPYGIMKHKIRMWFDQNYRAANAMPIAHAWQNSMSMRAAYVGHQLNAISKAARQLSPDQEILPSVFAGLQRGVSFTDPKQAELADMIQGVLGDFFDLDATGSMGNVFLRTTSQPDLINAMLKQKGIEQAFDLDLARRTAAETGVPLDQAIAGQWKTWKISDPLDFMHRLSQARQELAFNKGTALSFVEMARGLGAVSQKKAPGFVRIQASGKSRFAAHLPEGIYVKKELADELQRVETVYRTSREFQGAVGDFVRNTYAPLLNAWKFAITLPRPGHHIRNLIGDTSVTWTRRGNMHFARSWKDAVKLLSTRASYTDVNMLEAATRYGISDLPRGEDVLVKTGAFEFSADELYAALAEGGALPTYNIGEDFVDAGGKLNQILGKATLRDTRIGEALGKVSEGRDHLARFQHFIQALRQEGNGWKGSREALIDLAVKEVIKYHPDASLLTTVESKLRLVIPFYSWFGKILPALLESLVMHPGRISTFNKASYNWAVANGLDPESLSDPFPDDQLFPSFITESAFGPQFTAAEGFLGASGGEYLRMNPGIAHLDVLDTLGADPLRGIAGMVSPIVRVPAELLSGGSWQTGAPIKDWSDYLDSSIPGINYLANVSGVSPTGSVESLLQGQGLDQQLQVEKGNKTDFDKALSVANWITGLGVQNLSRPNYINYAEIEKRNSEGQK